MKWTDIEKAERWQAMSPAQRRAAREAYFNEVVLPKAPETLDQNELRSKWMTGYDVPEEPGYSETEDRLLGIRASTMDATAGALSAANRRYLGNTQIDPLIGVGKDVVSGAAGLARSLEQSTKPEPIQPLERLGPIDHPANLLIPLANEAASLPSRAFGAVADKLTPAVDALSQIEKPQSEFTDAMVGQARRQAQEARAGQSDEEKAAQQELATAMEGGFIPTAAHLLQNPGRVVAMGSDSLPYLVPGSIAGRAGGITAALATETGLTAGAVGEQTEQQVIAQLNSMDRLNLVDQFPEYPDLARKHGHDGAVSILAKRAGSAARGTGAATGLALARVMKPLATNEAVMAGIEQAGPTASRVLNTGIRVGGEVVQEGSQGASEAIAENVGVGAIDPSRSLTQGVGSAFAAEGIMGGAMAVPSSLAVKPLTDAQPETLAERIARMEAERGSPAVPPTPEAEGIQLAETLIAEAKAAKAPVPPVVPVPESVAPTMSEEDAGLLALIQAQEARQAAQSTVSVPSGVPVTNSAEFPSPTSESQAQQWGVPVTQSGAGLKARIDAAKAQLEGIPNEPPPIPDQGPPAIPDEVPASAGLSGLIAQRRGETAIAESVGPVMVGAQPEALRDDIDPADKPEAFGLPKRNMPNVRKQKPQHFDENHDDLLAFIALNGGLDRDAWEREGADPATWNSRQAQRTNRLLGPYSPPVFRKGAGMTPGELREAMEQRGFMQPANESGQATNTDDDAMQMVFSAVNQGEKFYTPAGLQVQSEIEAIRRQQQDLAMGREYDAQQKAMGAPGPDVPFSRVDRRGNRFPTVDRVMSMSKPDLLSALKRLDPNGDYSGRDDNGDNIPAQYFRDLLAEMVAEFDAPPAFSRKSEPDSQPTPEGIEVNEDSLDSLLAQGVITQSEYDQWSQGNGIPTAGPERTADEKLVTISGAVPEPSRVARSKVRGRTGGLAVIHRGSRGGVTTPGTFDNLGAGTKNPSAHLGAWFTSDPGEATKYGEVSPYKLLIENPKVYSAGDFPGFDTPEDARKFAQQLRKQGFDGIIMDARGEGGHVHFVAFSPDQIIATEPGKRTGTKDLGFKRKDSEAQREITGGTRDTGRNPSRDGRRLAQVSGASGGLRPEMESYGERSERNDGEVSPSSSSGVVNGLPQRIREARESGGRLQPGANRQSGKQGVRPSDQPSRRQAVDGARLPADSGVPADSPRASGIPANLPATGGIAVRRLSAKLAAAIGLGTRPNFQEVQGLPDTFARFAQELGRIFGVRVVVVRNNSPELIDFNGATLRDGVLYVSENADAPAVTVVMHELLHQMRRDRPDLYATIREEVERQGLIDAYAAKLQGQAEATNTDTGIDREVATEELAADAMGDALSDPDFLVGLARAKPGKFKQLARYILDALDDILAKLGAVKTLRSSEYLTDVSAFRTKLAGVLAEYEGGKRGNALDAAFQRVFHGTPHTVDKFRMDRMGTGEGAQAYGWGMYFAGRKEVAEHYRSGLSYRQIVRDFMSKLPEDADTQDALDYADQLPPKMGRVIRALAADDWLGFDLPSQALTAAFKEIDNFDPSQELRDAVKAISGNTYAVEVPEDSDLLDWDKPLAKQPKKVRDAVALAMSDAGVQSYVTDGIRVYLDVGAEDALRGQDIYKRLVREAYDGAIMAGDNASASLSESQKAASEYLNALGIPGLRFLDGTSRAKGEGSYNYVIWDEAAIGTPEPVFSRKEGGNPYDNAPRGLMGFPKDKPSKPFHDQKYKFVQPVMVTFGDGSYIIDAVKGLNKTHALARARVNWESAEITEATPQQYDDENGGGSFERDTDPIESRFSISRSQDDDEPAFSRKTPAEAAIENAQKRATVAADTGAQPSITFQYQDRFGDGIKGSLNRLRVQAQDKLLSAMYVQKDIEAVRGAISDYANVYRRENLMHGRVGDQFETLKRTHTDPLIKAMKAAKINDQLFEDYLEATFAPERNAIIAAKNPAMPDGGSGMTNQQAADFLAGKDVGHRSGVKVTPAQIAAMKTLAARVKALRTETLQRMVDSGEITDTARRAMEAAAPNYVPLRGKDGEEVTSGRGNGSGIDVRGKMVKEAMGRGAGNRAVNILAEVFGDAERSIVRAEKNRVGKSLARLVLENANKDLWEVEPVQTEQKLDSVGQVYQAVSPNASDQDAIRIMVNGKPFHVKIKYAPLREAMKNLGAEQVPAVLQPLAMIQRYASAILTRYNPAFVQVNMLRDLTQGLVGIAAEKGAKAAKNAAKYYPGAMRAIWRDARGTGSQSQIDRYAREFSEAGGKTFFHKVDNVEQIAGKVGAEFRSFTSLVKEGKVGLALNKAVADSTFLQVIEAANDAVENSIRLAAYAALRDSGVSIEKAAEYAKNLTVNFNRKGQSAGVMNSLILFYNAATQGSHRTLNLLSNRKVQLAMGALTTAQMVLAMMAMGADDQDEDGQTAWEKIPEHEKLRNFVFPIVGKDDQGRMKVKMVKWPMPFGFNVFSYAGGKLAELSRSKYPDPAKFASQLIVATIDATMPVKLYEGTDAVSPWLFRVFGAVSGNKDDLGMRIRNENPYSAYEQPKAEMGRADTPEVYKVIAKGLNRIGGGDEVTPPKMAGMLLDRAPEDLEYLAENLTGGIGRLGTQTYGLLEKLATGQGGTISTGEIPFLRTLVTSTDPAKGTQSLFYDRVEKVEREKDRARKALARGGIVEAKKVIAERPELAGAGFKRFKTGAYMNKAGAAQIQAKPGSLVKKLADSRKAVDDINDQIKAAQARAWPNLKSKMDAIRALQDRREKAQREFNVVYAKTVP